MKRSLKYIFVSFIATLFLTSCIENDVPYPRSLGKIVKFEVEGQKAPALIDTVSRVVTVPMEETADLTNVKLLVFEVSDNVTNDVELSQYIDFTEENTYVLETYPEQSYTWTVNATQDIERYIIAENQIGDAVFDPVYRSAVFYVTEGLQDIHILDIKLGPEGSVITPDPREIRDFMSMKEFEVSYRDIVEIWTVNAYMKDIQIETSTADAWTNHAYLSGICAQSASNPTFMYKAVNDTLWSSVPVEEVTVDRSIMTAHIAGLEPSTEYVFKAVADGMEGLEVTFVTEEGLQMPNMSFDDWYLDTPENQVADGKSWFPNIDIIENYWWDSGNQGANVLGSANPTSPEDEFVISGRAVRMQTASIVGKMAGGNIYSGQFLETVLFPNAGAKVDFGRPFTNRPSRMTGYYSYTPAVINSVKEPYTDLEGQNDIGRIFVILYDTEEPFRVDTSNEIFLPPFTDDMYIGYGELEDNIGTDGEYRQFTIDIVYKNNRKPKYCAVVAVASKYADYFTGGIGSLMYVDEFAFEYDENVIWENQ
ncbi:MAG: PCMD domain-containing protein [Bacteroidales bacterium]|nr:PCMD domain-containing protein [Bacteroidales bacterium]